MNTERVYKTDAMAHSIRKVGIYLRVSTQDQSCELQRRELLQYIESRGFQVFKIYEDKATGTNGNRPMLKELMADAKARRFDLLVCWKLDRLFRSLKGLVTTLNDLSEVGVEFISLKDQIDMTTSSGRLMTHILAAFAEFEASIIKERVRAGLANAKAKGKVLGRPTQIDSIRVCELRNQGLSLSQIAIRVGATKSGVSKTLKKSAVQVPNITRTKLSILAGDKTLDSDTLVSLLAKMKLNLRNTQRPYGVNQSNKVVKVG